MPPSSGSRRSNSRSHGGGSFRSRSGSRSTSRSSSQLRWVPKVPPVPEEGGATASRDTPAPTQQSWADQGGHVNYWQNKSADPIQQANWTGQGQDFPIPPPSDTGGTGPEAPRANETEQMSWKQHQVATARFATSSFEEVAGNFGATS